MEEEDVEEITEYTSSDEVIKYMIEQSRTNIYKL
jgi:hypothetical protein